VVECGERSAPGASARTPAGSEAVRTSVRRLARWSANAGQGYSAWRLRSWMLVTPVDLVAVTLPALWAPQHAKALICTAVLGVLLANSGRVYRTRVHISVLDELPRLLGRLLTAVAVVAVITALRHEQAAVTSFLVVSVWVLALFVLGRFATMNIVLAARCRRIAVHRTLLVGGGPLAAELAEQLAHRPRHGLAVCGYIDDDPGRNQVAGVGWLGGVELFTGLVSEYAVDTVLVTGQLGEDEHLIDIIRRRPADAYNLLAVPRMHQFHSQDGFADHVGAIPLMHINNPARRGLAWTVKRGIDIVASTLAIVVLFPVLLACAIAVRLEGGPGILFRQERVGGDGRIFECLKFRSMKPVDPQESATRWTVVGDPRVGKVGRVLRGTSLDELPQLWNILRGDMTLVGPRPERPHFVSKFSAEIPNYHHRHRVPGGLTGLAQVSGLRGDTPINDRAQFDNYYIENWSLWMDVKIIIRTFSEVFSGKVR
jgi:exopolysaccharide biosynthesis polyprenyl glycosylphosphotransferase